MKNISDEYKRKRKNHFLLWLISQSLIWFFLLSGKCGQPYTDLGSQGWELHPSHSLRQCVGLICTVQLFVLTTNNLFLTCTQQWKMSGFHGLELNRKKLISRSEGVY